MREPNEPFYELNLDEGEVRDIYNEIVCPPDVAASI